MSYKPTELKRLVLGGRKAADAVLVTAEHDGQRWASNAYWAVPAAWVRPLFDYYNLTDDPGRFSLNGSRVSRQPDAEPPNLGAVIGRVGDYTHVLTARTVDDLPVYVKLSNGRFAAVYERPDGGQVYLDDQYHAWIVDMAGQPISYGERWGKVELRQNERGRERGLDPVVYVATRQVRRGGYYHGELGAPDRRWQPERWEDAGEPEIVAVLMPVKVQA